MERRSLDEQAADSLASWSQRVSRRGVIAKVGKVAMWIAGVSAIPLLPLYRVEAQSGCGHFSTCGMWGYFCKACCDPSYNYMGSTTQCPPCTTKGGSWPRCCSDCSACPPVAFNMLYFDCCGPAGSEECQGSWCGNNPNQQPWWCAPAPGAYRCTVLQTGSPCTPSC